MSCARSVSRRDCTSRVRTHLVAPISCATLTSDGYSKQPVSSFTSTTRALISVESARRTNCHSLLDPNAHALTYSALMLRGAAYDSGSGLAERVSLAEDFAGSWATGVGANRGVAAATAACAETPPSEI